MTKSMNQSTDEELKDFPIRNIINGWFFRIDEVSYGYYRVTGIDKFGRTATRDGNDPDELLQLCKKDILESFLRKQHERQIFGFFMLLILNF